ncbi:hypothetical protein GCM10022406_09870 [Hymenobacter algoricola]|uniref:Uncharacterized protein n=1 Tax=Hymenobacter algoricola TaxID=486267 RepID=A0ABP7MPQ4_9BACT
MHPALDALQQLHDKDALPGRGTGHAARGYHPGGPGQVNYVQQGNLPTSTLGQLQRYLQGIARFHRKVGGDKNILHGVGW